MARGLTRRQRDIYEYIVDSVEERGYPPSLMEIARAFGLSSPSGIADHLKAIERKGFIRRRRGISRGIELTRVDMVRSRRRTRTVKLPLVGAVPSERGLDSPEEASVHVHVDRRLAASGAVVVRNRLEGFEGRGILPGDLLVVVGDGESDRGALVIARIDGRTTLVEVGRARSRSREAGPSAAGRRLDPLGRVVAVLRSLRLDEGSLGTRAAEGERKTTATGTTTNDRRRGQG